MITLEVLSDILATQTTNPFCVLFVAANLFKETELRQQNCTHPLALSELVIRLNSPYLQPA